MLPQGSELGWVSVIELSTMQAPVWHPAQAPRPVDFAVLMLHLNE
jgi:hypothetical protein